MALTEEELAKVCFEPDPDTEDFIMQQTMYRIKDPRKSLEFYTKVLGMRLLWTFHAPEAKFSLYFVGYAKAEEIPKDPKERQKWVLKRPGTVELTHNYGTENQPDFKYCDGNAPGPSQGFGHIGVAVPDVYAICDKFEKLDVKFVKKPDDGRMKGLAFIQDPDGYRVEIFNSRGVE